MVYLKKWENFTLASQNLVDNSERPTRYTILFKPSSGSLVLKITNDITCIKFKTNSSLYLNRFESLNKSLIQRYTNQHLLPVPLVSESTKLASSILPSASTDSKDVVMKDGVVVGGAGTEGGGGGEEVKAKKKKGKKKK